MDLRIFEEIEAMQPRLNESTTRGYDPDEFTKELERYANNVLKCAAESFPPQLKYVTFTRATPYEQLSVASKQTKTTRPNKSRRVVDLSRSTTYMIKIHLTFDGQPIPPVYTHLPFVTCGNLLYFRGTRYRLFNVISGSVFNIERRSIFLPLPVPRAKLGFYLTNTGIDVSGMISNGSMICSRLFNAKNNKSNLHSPVLLYILCEYGLAKTMEFFDINYILSIEGFDNLNPEEYVVFKSKNSHRPSNRNKIQIAVLTSETSPLVNDVIATIFYIIDNGLVYIDNFAEELDNPELFIRILELFIFNKTSNTKSQYSLMISHLFTVRMYMDAMLKDTLRKHDIHCNTIYDLFKYMIMYYQDIMIHHDTGGMYGLEISSIKYLLYNFTHNIFSLVQNIRKIPEPLLTYRRICDFIPKNIKKEKILSVEGHGELSSDAISSECMLLGSTGKLINYTKATMVGGGKRGTMYDPTLALHYSQCEIASGQWINKADPTGRSIINPFAIIYGGITIHNPKIQHSVLALKQKLN